MNFSTAARRRPVIFNSRNLLWRWRESSLSSARWQFVDPDQMKPTGHVGLVARVRVYAGAGLNVSKNSNARHDEEKYTEAGTKGAREAMSLWALWYFYRS